MDEAEIYKLMIITQHTGHEFSVRIFTKYNNGRVCIKSIKGNNKNFRHRICGGNTDLGYELARKLRKDIGEVIDVILIGTDGYERFYGQ